MPSVFAARVSDALTDLGVTGANPNPYFTAMLAENLLHEIGLRPGSTSPDAPWSRPALDNPAPVPGMPRGLALIPAAAVAMLRWKLQGRDK